jgi:hypothetical protein
MFVCFQRSYHKIGQVKLLVLPVAFTGKLATFKEPQIFIIYNSRELRMDTRIIFSVAPSFFVIVMICLVATYGGRVFAGVFDIRQDAELKQDCDQ